MISSIYSLSVTYAQVRERVLVYDIRYIVQVCDASVVLRYGTVRYGMYSIGSVGYDYVRIVRRYTGCLFVIRERAAEHWRARESGVRGVAMATPASARRATSDS